VSAFVWLSLCVYVSACVTTYSGRDSFESWLKLTINLISA